MACRQASRARAVVGVDGLDPAEALDLVGALSGVGPPAGEVLGAALGRGGPGDLSRSPSQGLIAILVELSRLVDGLGRRVQGRNLSRRGPIPGLVNGLGRRVQERGLGRGGRRAIGPAIERGGSLMFTRYHDTPLQLSPRGRQRTTYKTP